MRRCEGAIVPRCDGAAVRWCDGATFEDQSNEQTTWPRVDRISRAPDRRCRSIGAHRHIISGNPDQWFKEQAAVRMQEFLEAGCCAQGNRVR